MSSKHQSIGGSAFKNIKLFPSPLSMNISRASSPIGDVSTTFILPPQETFTIILALDAIIHNMQESPPRKRFSVGCSSTFMRLAKPLTALRAWC